MSTDAQERRARRWFSHACSSGVDQASRRAEPELGLLIYAAEGRKGVSRDQWRTEISMRETIGRAGSNGLT